MKQSYKEIPEKRELWMVSVYRQVENYFHAEFATKAVKIL